MGEAQGSSDANTQSACLSNNVPVYETTDFYQEVDSDDIYDSETDQNPGNAVAISSFTAMEKTRSIVTGKIFIINRQNF